MDSNIPISSLPTIHFKGISTPHITTRNSTATNPCSCKLCLCHYLYVPLPSGLSLKTHEGRLLVSEVPKAWVFGWEQSKWTSFLSNIKLWARFGLPQRNGVKQCCDYCSILRRFRRQSFYLCAWFAGMLLIPKVWEQWCPTTGVQKNNKWLHDLQSTLPCRKFEMYQQLWCYVNPFAQCWVLECKVLQVRKGDLSGGHVNINEGGHVLEFLFEETMETLFLLQRHFDAFSIHQS